MKSARYLAGSFYTVDLSTCIFTPLHETEKALFQAIVEDLEREYQSRLSLDELYEVVELIEEVGGK